MREKLGVMIAIVSSCLGGTAAAVTRYLVDDADPVTLAILRWAIGCLFLLPVALVLGAKWPHRADWPGVIALGFCFFGLFFIFYNISVGYTTAARASLALSTLPLQTMIVVGDDDSKESELEHNFRRLLKARCMHLGTPLQLVREKTILITKQSGDQQDPATKAWNFCTALYYKGNRTVPWRLVEDTAKLRSCYIGIGFYKSRDGETVSSSLAQVFDEFGHGIILRGTPVSSDKKKRHPYLSEHQAYELLRDALDEYDRALEHMPARIVIHKSSHFRESERKGFLRALDEKGIRSKDFIAITDTDIRLFGDKNYPPKRGTLLTISETEGVLYTRGTVDFYKTYPGMYVPNPLKIAVYEQDSSLESLSDEILGLTKMNWNNTQMDGRLPITLECARKIGDIMKYVSVTEKPQVSYSFYM